MYSPRLPPMYQTALHALLVWLGHRARQVAQLQASRRRTAPMMTQHVLGVRQRCTEAPGAPAVGNARRAASPLHNDAAPGALKTQPAAHLLPSGNLAGTQCASQRCAQLASGTAAFRAAVPGRKPRAAATPSGSPRSSCEGGNEDGDAAMRSATCSPQHPDTPHARSAATFARLDERSAPRRWLGVRPEDAELTRTRASTAPRRLRFPAAT